MTPRVSAVIIARNEDQCIGACLTSLAGVDEIVLCDTGSRDDATIREAHAAAQKAGIPIRFTETKWADDFAAARNIANTAALGDWILSIDADETLSAGSLALLRDTVAQAKGRTVSVRLVAAGTGNWHRVVRCFRRGVKWVGAIHEAPEHNDGEQCDAEITYGSSPAHALDPDRNIRILSRAVAVNPEHARNLYYLAREYWYRQDWDTAGKLFQRCLKATRFLAEKADAHLYLARILLKLKRPEDAKVECLNALGVNPNFAEALRFMGELTGDATWCRYAALADNSGVLFVRN